MSKRKSDVDGGYAWVIMLTFFLLELLVDGIRFSFGLYFVEFLEEFKRGKGVTAWSGSLMVATYNLTGPVLAIIVNKVGYRRACFIGSITTTIGFLLSSFVTDVFYLYATYGVLQGFGFGLMFLSGTVAVSRYFYKKRARAMGFGLCGAGIGMLAFTPLVRYAIDMYTWRGSMFILAGFSLNGCVLAMLLKPIEERNLSMELDVIGNELVLESVQELNESEVNMNTIAQTPECEHCNDNNSTHTCSEDQVTQNKSISSCNCSVVSIDRPSETVEPITMNGSDKNTVIVRQNPLNDIDENRQSDNHIKTSAHSPLLTEAEVVHSNGNALRPLSPLQKLSLYQSPVQLSSSKHTIHGSHRSLRSLDMSILSQSILGSNASFEYIFEKRKRTKTLSTLAVNKKSQDIDIKSEATDVGTDKFSNSLIEALFPKVLVMNVDYQLLMATCIFAGIPAFIPYSMLPDLAQTSGATTAQSAWTMSAIGIGATTSRFGGGLLSDMSCVHNLTLLSASFFGCGITAIIVAFFHSYAIVMTYAVLYGVFFGAVYIVQPIVLLEYLGEDYIAETMGSLMFTYGVTQFIGSPVAGWIFDATSSYTISFVVAGLLFLVAGVVNQSVMCTKYCHKQNDNDSRKPVDV